MASIEKKRFLRIKEVFDLLGGALPLSTLYHIIVVCKKMAYIRVGRAILIPRESFEAFMADGRGK